MGVLSLRPASLSFVKGQAKKKPLGESSFLNEKYTGVSLLFVRETGTGFWSQIVFLLTYHEEKYNYVDRKTFSSIVVVSHVKFILVE